MNPFANLMLARAMQEELHRQVHPAHRVEDDLTWTPKPRRRTWAAILSFPRFQPAKG